MGILTIEELQGRTNADESVLRVNESFAVRGAKAIDKAIIGLLSSRQYDKICR